MRYLVTGASGFVGKHLCARLHKEGHEVFTICRDEAPAKYVNSVRGSIEDSATVKRAISEFQPNFIFHLAAQSKVGVASRDPIGTWESNVRGTYTLLNEVGSIPTTVASSDHCYGNNDSGKPYVETDAVAAHGIYDTSKACTDLIAQCYQKMGKNISIARCGNIYGPGDKDLSRIIPSFINDAISRGTIRVLSDGTPKREYVYISDAIDAYMLISGRSAGIYNVSGQEHSALEIAEFVRDLFEHYNFDNEIGMQKTYIEILGKRGKDEIDSLTLNGQKIHDLGFVNKRDIEWGLKNTAKWWMGETVPDHV